MPLLLIPPTFKLGCVATVKLRQAERNAYETNIIKALRVTFLFLFSDINTMAKQAQVKKRDHATSKTSASDRQYEWVIKYSCVAALPFANREKKCTKLNRMSRYFRTANSSESLEKSKMYIWPEWSDAEVSKEKWDVSKGEGRKSTKTKSNSVNMGRGMVVSERRFLQWETWFQYFPGLQRLKKILRAWTNGCFWILFRLII